LPLDPAGTYFVPTTQSPDPWHPGAAILAE